MKKLQQAILVTLVYHDIFDYPLTVKEIEKFLLLNSKLKTKSSKLQLKTQNLKKNLTDLVNKRIIGCKDNYYLLPPSHRQPRGVCRHSLGVNIVELRKKREKFSQEKLKIAKEMVRILKHIPWLKMIGITGALAMSNSEENDDIDFLIITRSNRLWLVRLLTVIVLELLGKRRRPKAKNIQNKICLNMLLDETVLSLSKEKQNLFTAHEICQMKPIFDRHNTYKKFLLANLWVRRYLPNSLEIKNSKLKNKKSTHYLPAGKQAHLLFIHQRRISLWLTYLLNFLEDLVYQLQLKYMKSKKTSEKVDHHFAFFHPQNRNKEILEEYKKEVKQFTS